MVPVRPGRFVSVGTKLTAALLALVILSTLYGYLDVSRRGRQERMAGHERGARMVTELFASSVAAPLSFADDSGVREQLALLMANAEVTYAAVWATNQDGLLPSPLAVRQRVPFRSPSPTLGRRASSRLVDDVLVIDQPVLTTTGEALGVVRVVFSTAEEAAANAADARRTLTMSLTMGLVLSVVLVALTRVLVSRRLRRLTAAVQGLEQGKMVDVELGANDEVNDLAAAFASMAEAIHSREARITRRNRDMRRVLDNVTEGLLTVKSDGTMSDERSRVLDEWFGPPPEGTSSVVDYFRRLSPTSAQWLQIGLTALGDDCMPVEVILDQMPRRFSYQARFYQVDYLPIWRGPEADQLLEELLVVVRDITSNVERERAAMAQREALVVFRRILDDRAGFREFYREASRLLDRIAAATTGPFDASRLARDIHTLKGNTAVYGVESVASLCHKIETRLLEDGGGIGPNDVTGLRDAWSMVQKVYEELNSADDRIELSQDEYSHYLTTLQVRLPDDSLTIAARNWANEAATTRLQRIAEQGRSIALRLGKPGTIVETHAVPSNLRLPPQKWASFWSVFSHVLRNTFDHGIESPSERTAAGKNAAGKVEISVVATKSGIEVRVRDDGRGIAWHKIREKAKKLGLPHETQEDLEEALFSDSVSAKDEVTETSGRGVGMGAVRDAVRASGGVIVIESSKGCGTLFRFRFPLSMLDSVRFSALPSVA